MKRTVSIVLAVTLAATSAVGCGKKENVQTDAVVGSSTEAATTEAGERTKIQLMGPWVVESPEDQVLAGVVKGFEEAHPEYEVELIGTPSADLLTTVQSMAASSTLPDLVITNGANNAAWKEMGIVEDIRGEFDQKFLEGFYPEMLKEFTYNDELFGLPMCAAPFVLLLRNDLLQEAGLDVPESFDEIVETAKKLTVDTNGDGKIDRYGMSLMGFPDGNNALRFTLALFAADAPDIYKDESGKWATKIGSEDGVRAFEFYYNLAIRDGSVPQGSTEVDYKTMVNLLPGIQVRSMSARGCLPTDSPYPQSCHHHPGSPWRVPYGAFGKACLDSRLSGTAGGCHRGRGQPHGCSDCMPHEGFSHGQSHPHSQPYICRCGGTRRSRSGR